MDLRHYKISPFGRDDNLIMVHNTSKVKVPSGLELRAERHCIPLLRALHPHLFKKGIGKKGTSMPIQQVISRS